MCGHSCFVDFTYTVGQRRRRGREHDRLKDRETKTWADGGSDGKESKEQLSHVRERCGDDAVCNKN